MDWINRMDKVIEYIERNLDSEINYETIAKIACCSVYNFQRIFSFLFNMPLSEYIRNRRLTAAAAELRESNIRVIDAAVKYQYESQESFSRAFQKFHGVTPTAAKKKECVLSICPKASVNFNEKRVTQMCNQETDSMLLQRNESKRLFFQGVKGPGTLRAAMSMWSYLEFVGIAHDACQTYTILSALTGELFSPAVTLCLPSGISRMLDVMGFEHEIYTAYKASSNYLDKTAMKRVIVENLSKKKQPAIVVTGGGDWCFGGTVIGYENGGETLVNWSYFPFDDSQNPQPILNQNSHWYAENETVLAVIRGRKTLSGLENVYRAGVKAAVADLSENYRAANQKFYADWQHVLLQSMEETVLEAKQTRKIPCTWEMLQDNVLTSAEIEKTLLEIVDPLWCDYAERRFYAARFLEQAAVFLPKAKADLAKAMELFDEIHNLMYAYIAKVDHSAGTDFINVDKFRDSAVRREMAAIVEQCRLNEQKAVQYLKRAED
ncbi:MAG: helix-turn-helix transcriptional regulator [Lachnospiraceae bacterium]|nr:helix-turn-helix transcriptional regulator [Lachnospiraceae bacterium]